MPVETFRTLIARNRRNSVILIAVFCAFFVGLGLLIGAAWGGGDLAFAAAVAIAAGGLAMLLTIISYYGGAGAILSMSNARPIQKADDPQLWDVVEELTIAGGVPMPRLYVIDDPALNAFSTGRDPQHAVLAITSGLREKLNRDELQGVMAHELSHVRDDDILFSMLMAVMVGVIVLLCDVFLRSMWWGGYGGRYRTSRQREEGGGGGGLQIILVIIGLVLAVIAPLLARIIQMAMSRQREYLADAAGVELTRNPEGLAQALEKIANDTHVLRSANRATAHLYIVHPIKKFEERSGSLFDSHPPIQDRIARLRRLEV